jgi:hypothetical protein
MFELEADGGEGVGDGGDGGSGGGGAARSVPYDRFQSVVEAKAAALEELRAAKAEVQTLSEKAATVDTLADQVATWKTKAEAATAQFGRYQTISGALETTDPDAIEAAEWQYGKLGAENRPELAAWLGEMKADPAKAPAVLRPWLTSSDAGAGDAGAGDAAAAAAAAAARRHGAGGGAGGGAGAGGGSLTEAKIREVRDRAIRTGDWAEWRELRKTVGT